MRSQHTKGTGVRVQAQGRAYVAVIGVTVGMLVAGLAVPLAFGRTPGTVSAGSADSLQLDEAFSESGSPVAGSTPGEVTGPDGAPLPGANGTGGAPEGQVPPGAPGAPGSAGAPEPGSDAAAAPGAPAKGPLKATDQGVTATDVKLGVVLLDIRALEPLGFGQPNFQPDDQRRRFQAYIDAVNKSGGLWGRRIAPVYAEYDPLDSRGSRSGAAVCINLARDQKVFAVMGFLDGNIAECVSQQYGLPALANVGHVAESYTKGRNLLTTPYMSLERGAANWGDIVANSGLLRGRTTATLYTDIVQEARPEKALVDALRGGGHIPAYRAKLTGDPASAQSQMPIEISKMQQAGVDTVFLATSFVTALQFANAAEGQNFRPQYIVSDLGSLTAPGLVSSMPASFDGAIGFAQSRPQLPESAENKKCRETYNANASGRDYAPGEDGGVMTLICWMTTVFEAGAELVGPQLTRTGMASAFQRLTIPVPHMQPGSFGAGKTDYADYMRVIKYDRACKCYRETGISQKGRY